jgi:hypothetical protein
VIPHLDAELKGGYTAMCGKCLESSKPVFAQDRWAAWEALLRTGWTVYAPMMLTAVYARCPRCSEPSKPSKPARKQRKKEEGS